MSRFNTGNPLGSGSPLDLDDNAKNMDEATNSIDPTWIDRFGRERPTLATAIDPSGLAQTVVDAAGRAEAASNNAFVNANVYATVAAGRAAVAVGEQFQVLSTDGSEYIRYRKDSASTQTEVARFPSSERVEDIANTYATKKITDTHLDDLTLAGDYSVIGTYATEENGYPITGHDCFISVELAGTYGRIQTVKSRVGEIATRTLRSQWTAWEKSIKSTEAPLNRGTLDGAELLTLEQEGTYFVTNATDYPPDFGRTTGFFTVTKFELRFKRELIDLYDYSNRYVQMGAGSWEKVSTYATKKITDIHLDELTLAGNYAVVGTYATEENGYPITGHDCFISVEVAGTYGLIQTVKSRVGEIATRTLRSQWTAWEKSIKSTEAPLNRGALDGAELLTLEQEGTYFVTNATDYPLNFGRTAGFFTVKKYGLRFERELIDQYDYSNRYVQMGAGAWEKVGSLDMGELPEGEVKTDILSEDGSLYNSFGTVSARQTSYGDMYDLTNAEVASGDMLATVYSFFDELVVDFPDYVSMQVLGTENTGLEIREYVILPRKINKMASSPASINTFPEILLFAGQHGQEYTAIVNLMIFCDEMMRNYNSREIYGTLRTSAVLRIMPAMNPWGVKNADRRNSNNVDLNRNFPDGWENAAGDKGDSPLSEIESVTLSGWVEANAAKAICTLNLHDHSDRALTWGTATAGWPEKLLFRSFQRVGKWYYSNFEDTTLEDPVSWLGNPRDGYADKYIFETLGVPALMFECPYINHPKLGNKISSVRLSSRQILTEIMEMIMGRYFRDLD